MSAESFLNISQVGDAVLRRSAEPVTDFQDKRIQELIDNLITTGRQANGVGIAAPQVAESLRLFIVASRPNLRYPHAPTMEPTAMINPKIIAHCDEIVKDWEGCLSVPGVRGLVPRFKSIDVEYFDRNGNKWRQQLTNFVARIFQHEYDHLNGILFIDRVKSSEDLISEEEYQKLLLL